MPPDSTRLDIWLDVACLFKTRSEAQKACRNGKILVNGQAAKSHRIVHSGDEVRIGRSFGLVQTVIVRALADRHIARADARLLYEDLTPPPSPEEIETRRIDRQYRAAARAAGRPDKRRRRELERLKGRR